MPSTVAAGGASTLGASSFIARTIGARRADGMRLCAATPLIAASGAHVVEA